MGRASKSSPKTGAVWSFPTRVEDFKKPEVEELFGDFWKSIDEQEMENHFKEFWRAIRLTQDTPVDMTEFWRHVEGKNRKPGPKENLASQFWKMIESQQEAKVLDEPAIAGHFLRMAQKSENEARESRPWETPARDMWKLIQHEENRLVENKLSPETLAGDFFLMTSNKKRQAPKTPSGIDAELMTGQFWKMVDKQTIAGREVKFVADQEGNVFRNIKGHQMKAKRRESMIEARLVNEFFTLVENEKDGDEESITFVVDSSGRIFQQKNAKKGNINAVFWKIALACDAADPVTNKTGKSASRLRSHHDNTSKIHEQIKKPGKSASKAKMVKDFFSMIDKEQKHDDAKVESFAGNFWKMINNSEVRPERKSKEALAGEFWKTVEFIESLKKKRETMRRLSASRRDEAEFAVAPLFTAAATRKTAGDFDAQAKRKAAMLLACATLEQQQLHQHIFVNERPVGRQRTLSSSSSSLFSVKEEGEEALKTSRAAAAATFRVTPHYCALPLNSTNDARNGSGVIRVAQRQNKKTAKPQQCHRQNMVAQERRGSITRRNRIPSISNGSNNDRKCGKRAW